MKIGNLSKLAPGNFVSGGFTLQFYRPWLVITNGDTVSHTFTLTLKSFGGAVAHTVTSTQTPSETLPYPTAAFASISIDSPSAAVTYFYSVEPLNSGNSVSATIVGSSTAEMISSLTQLLAGGDLTNAVLFTMPTSQRGRLVGMTLTNGFGAASVRFYLWKQWAAGTNPAQDQITAPSLVVPLGTTWYVGLGAGNNLILPPEGIPFGPGDILAVTTTGIVGNSGGSSSVEIQWEFDVEPL